MNAVLRCLKWVRLRPGDTLSYIGDGKVKVRSIPDLIASSRVRAQVAAVRKMWRDDA